MPTTFNYDKSKPAFGWVAILPTPFYWTTCRHVPLSIFVTLELLPRNHQFAFTVLKISHCFSNAIGFQFLVKNCGTLLASCVAGLIFCGMLGQPTDSAREEAVSDRDANDGKQKPNIQALTATGPIDGDLTRALPPGSLRGRDMSGTVIGEYTLQEAMAPVAVAWSSKPSIAAWGASLPSKCYRPEP